MANAETITDTLPVATDDRNIPPLSSAVALWQIAIAEFERTKAACDTACRAHSAAEDAAKADHDAADATDYWKTYGLHGGLTEREEIVRELAWNLATTHSKSAKAGKALTDEGLEKLYSNIPRIADAFLAKCAAIKSTNERHRVDKFEKAMCDASDEYWESFKKLMQTPAPDGPALIAKLEVLTGMLTDDASHDLPYVSAIRDDARRLFGSK